MLPPKKVIQAAVKKYGTITAAAEALGIPRTTLGDAIRRMADLDTPTELPAKGFVVKKKSATYRDGEMQSISVQTVAAPGDVFKPLPGHRVKGESALVNPDGQILAKWVKTGECPVTDDFIEAMKVSFAKFEGAAPLVRAPAKTQTKTHTIYPLADLHMGMYAWGEETGANYDVDIAVARARAAYRSLIEVTPQSKTATLLNLGDFFHANDQKNVTPGHGHQLDVDGRHPRVLEAGADLLLEIIDLLLQSHDEVEVVCLAGNHDPDVAAALRVALRLYYRKHNRVQVYNSPGIAWYRRFGKNLWGATHGHTVKQGDLPGMMACDRPQDWGLTEYRNFFTAHIHHERAVEKAGVRVESFQTLATRDSYATNGGWRSGHSVQAITFHESKGEVSRSRVNVLPTMEDDHEPV